LLHLCVDIRHYTLFHLKRKASGCFSVLCTNGQLKNYVFIFVARFEDVLYFCKITVSRKTLSFFVFFPETDEVDFTCVFSFFVHKSYFQPVFCAHTRLKNPC